jgi:hypothetical protein
MIPLGPGRMRSAPAPIFLLGGVLFVLGAGCVVLWVAGHGYLFLGLGFVAAVLALLVLAFGAWRRRGEGRNPREMRREQLLWRSGPLGRRWLRIRRRLF